MNISISKLLIIVIAYFTFTDASMVYDKAVSFYKSGQYDSTISVIRRFLKTNGKDPETEVLIPLYNEALLRKGDYSTVLKLFPIYRQKFSNSSYMSRMWYQKGIANTKQKNYSDAIYDFSAALNGGVNGVLEKKVIRNVELLCENLTVEQILSLDYIKCEHKIQETLRYFEITKLISAGQFGKVQTLAGAFLESFPHSKYESIVKNIVIKAKDQERSSIQIGILAPLSGDAAEIGKRVVQGAQLAFELSGTSSRQSINPVIYDTKGNMMENARRTKELIEVDKVSLILGPVLSQDAIVSASMVMGKNTVMLTPTATEDGIAELGDYIFQMNVSIGTLGRKIAAYAMDNLNMKEFAILAPQNEYGITLANSFKEELKKKNITVVAEEFFEEGGNDFSVQFNHLRSVLLQKHFEKIAAEKGLTYKGKVTKADSIKYADSTLTVGGLFIPAEADDVVMLAPQVAFNRIKTQILGSNGWQSKKVIKDGSTYVQGAMISATIEPDQSSQAWINFKKSFKTRFNYEPDRITALGYDAANLIINAVRESGGGNSSRIASALSKIRGYQGLSGVVSFSQANGGSNTESTIMKITANGFVRVQ